MDQVSRNLEEKKGISEFEFIALMAFLMSNIALCIDGILPALPNVGLSLEVSNSNRLQLVIVMVFLGLGIGELIFGTLSDSFGRKPIVYVGVSIFILASFLVIFAPNLEVFLIGRVLQGIGLSAARSVSIAIIRDTYVGDRMARIMSFIMTVFILMPMVAPLLGQALLEAYNWQAIFYFQLIFIGVTIVWFWLRQKETLPEEKRIAMSRSLFMNGLKEYFRHKNTVIYMVITGSIQGAFMIYLSAAQQIFQEQYEMVKEFPYIFGGLSLAMGIASLLNGVLVIKYGMLKLVNTALYFYIIIPLAYVLYFLNSSNPDLYILLIFFSLQFFAMGLIYGNLSSLAMQPIGHIAGVGAAIFSFTSISLAVIFAIIIGSFIQDTVLPVFVGFFLSGVIAIGLIQKVRVYS